MTNNKFSKNALRLSLVAASLVLASSNLANATIISQTFTSGVEGGIVTFDDNLGSNQFRLTFDNTSSMWNGAITGVVFNVSADINAASVFSFVDGNGAAITGWTIGFDIVSSISPGNTKFDITFAAGNIQNGIYNNGVATNTSNVVPDIATLILTISDPNPWALASIGSDSVLRMQRTGADGQGSLKIVTSTSSTSSTSGLTGNGNQIPEPGVLGLLGIGLLGQVLLLRQRRRRLQK